MDTRVDVSIPSPTTGHDEVDSVPSTPGRRSPAITADKDQFVLSDQGGGAFGAQLDRALGQRGNRGVDTSQSEVTHQFREQLTALAQDRTALEAFLKMTFGETIDRAAANRIFHQVRNGDFSWLPKVQFVGSEVLRSANGAYDQANGVIYLHSDLSPEQAAATFVEEMGHYLDTLLNGSDTKGDEGELFRRLLSGEELSSEQIAAIRRENDHGTLTVNGKVVSVEFRGGGGRRAQTIAHEQNIDRRDGPHTRFSYALRKHVAAATGIDVNTLRNAWLDLLAQGNDEAAAQLRQGILPDLEAFSGKMQTVLKPHYDRIAQEVKAPAPKTPLVPPVAAHQPTPEPPPATGTLPPQTPIGPFSGPFTFGGFPNQPLGGIPQRSYMRFEGGQPVDAGPIAGALDRSSNGQTLVRAHIAGRQRDLVNVTNEGPIVNGRVVESGDGWTFNLVKVPNTNNNYTVDPVTTPYDALANATGIDPLILDQVWLELNGREGPSK